MIPYKTIYILTLSNLLGGCGTIKLLNTNSYTLYGTYVEYNCQPITKAKISAENNIQQGGYLTSTVGSTSTDTTNAKGHFELTLYEGNDSHIKASYSFYYKLNKVDLEQLNGKTTEENRIYFYKKHTSHNYDVLPETRGWLLTSLDYKQSSLVGRYSKKQFISIGRTANKVGFISNKENEDKTGWEVLIQAKDDYRIQEQNVDFNGLLPVNGYSSQIIINVPYSDFDKWKQYNYFVKYGNGSYYGLFTIDIKLNSWVAKTDIGEQELIKIKAWSTNQYIKSTISDSTLKPLSGDYKRSTTPLSKRAPIKKPYIPLKVCGTNPDFHNKMFIRHPAKSKLEKRQEIKSEERRKRWEETIKEENSMSYTK